MRSEVEILQQSRVVAVVGASNNPKRPGNIAPRFLMEHGYRIIPVNPNEAEVLGQKCYPNLAAIPEKVDIVSVFRRSEDVPPIVQEAIQVGARAVWMQEGVVNEEAAQEARQHGLDAVMDRCIHCAIQDHLKELGKS
ncbi:MAG: CoA-binding protein [Chloroflexi bacterium]|nr:CoA-binding protein [Chloroflexota bacterium]